jgi:hypothetical protein
MSTKLTLRLDEDLIKIAKKTAKAKRTSISKMVTDYFTVISLQEKKEPVESPILSEIAGVLSSQKNNKKLLRSHKQHLEDKYL